MTGIIIVKFKTLRILAIPNIMQRCKASNLSSQRQEKYLGKSCHLHMYVL